MNTSEKLVIVALLGSSGLAMAQVSTTPTPGTPATQQPSATTGNTTVPTPRVNRPRPNKPVQGVGTSTTNGAGALGGGTSGSTGTGANMGTPAPVYPQNK